LYTLAIPSDPDYTSQWGFVNLNMEAAWDKKKNSDSVTVAVIDSGIIPNHPDLVNNLLQGADFVGGTNNAPTEDYNMTDSDPTDETTYLNGGSHGTHVAGIIGAVGNNNQGVTGVNWSTNILPIRVLGPNGGTVWDELEGIYYAIDRGADVINLSLGGLGYIEAEHTAIKDAYNSDIVIIAAAGNGGSDGIGDY
jgi:serine protease